MPLDEHDKKGVAWPLPALGLYVSSTCIEYCKNKFSRVGNKDASVPCPKSAILTIILSQINYLQFIQICNNKNIVILTISDNMHGSVRFFMGYIYIGIHI